MGSQFLRVVLLLALGLLAASVAEAGFVIDDFSQSTTSTDGAAFVNRNNGGTDARSGVLTANTVGGVREISLNATASSLALQSTAELVTPGGFLNDSSDGLSSTGAGAAITADGGGTPLEDIAAS